MSLCWFSNSTRDEKETRFFFFQQLAKICGGYYTLVGEASGVQVSVIFTKMC